MAKSFERITKGEFIDELKHALREWHRTLEACDVRIDVLEVCAADKDGFPQPALKVNGYTALATIKISSPKERALGLGDALLCGGRGAHGVSGLSPERLHELAMALDNHSVLDGTEERDLLVLVRAEQERVEADRVFDEAWAAQAKLPVCPECHGVRDEDWECETCDGSGFLPLEE